MDLTSISLFSDKLISDQVQSQLPQGFRIRPLQSTDFDLGFLEALSHLTTVGPLNKAQFLDRFHYLKAHSHEYFTIVIEDLSKNRIAAAGTIKYVHENGLVGHVEDIVVHKEYRKMNFGLYIIQQLKHIGNASGCYKVILDCSEKNAPFYEKCGFAKKGLEMAWYIEEPKAKL